MHAKSGLRVVLEWKIYRPDSVIADVITLNRMAENPYKPTANMTEGTAESAAKISLGQYVAGLLIALLCGCLLYTSPSPRDGLLSRMPSSA